VRYPGLHRPAAKDRPPFWSRRLAIRSSLEQSVRWTPAASGVNAPFGPEGRVPRRDSRRFAPLGAGTCRSCSGILIHKGPGEPGRRGALGSR
jgi:hypothetical protein